MRCHPKDGDRGPASASSGPRSGLGEEEEEGTW